MKGTIVTCSSVGVYGHAISRGKQYEVVDYNGHNIRIKGNHGRLIWVNQRLFNLDGQVEPVMVKWQFDDENPAKFDLLEITITFSNDERRWCLLTTPEKLVHHFNCSNLEPPGMNIRHLIINQTLSEVDITKTLEYLDQQGELYAFTLPLE
ncbi:hypothetical protein [Paenibacillus sp. y28]|uniref:hypothetical protein n=1 Tax=Paenibacillus sp. y28 TaxID=3129110 RepID=UPI00301AAC6D